METSENIYQTFIPARTYVQKSALLLIKLLTVIFKALKSSDFFFLHATTVFIVLISSCSHPPQQLQLVRVCLLANLNSNTSRQTQHQMKSLAKPPLTSLGMRPTGRTRLPWEACITVIHILLSLWEPGWDTIWRPFYSRFMWHTTSLSFCKIARKVFYYLQVTNRRGWMSHWRQFWASSARRLPVSGKVHPTLPFLLHSRSQNNVAVLNIEPPCSSNKWQFLQRVQATTFVKISTWIWDVILA